MVSTAIANLEKLLNGPRDRDRSDRIFVRWLQKPWKRLAINDR